MAQNPTTAFSLSVMRVAAPLAIAGSIYFFLTEKAAIGIIMVAVGIFGLSVLLLARKLD